MAKLRIGSSVRHIVLVEGTHDKDFVEKMLLEHGLATEVLALGGKTQLGDTLKILVRDAAFSNFESLVVLRDADSILTHDRIPIEQPSELATRSAAMRSLDSVRACLLNAGLSAPSAHGQVTDAAPRIGVFIFPDGRADGMLESLCREALRDNKVTPCVDAFFDCVAQLADKLKFSPKAWTHAFIAVQEDPDLHLGKAARKGYLPLKHDAFADLVKFLRSAHQVTLDNE